MKKYSALFVCLLLAACGSESEQQADSGLPPKPAFTLRYIDEGVLKDLPLGKGVAQTVEDKPHIRYAIKGISGNNEIDLIGEHSNDLEAVRGQCKGSDIRAVWAKEGVCRKVFSTLVGNIADNDEEIMTYLMRHANLDPFQAGRSGYAAVQNGRYILELDSDGMFTFRRRRY